MNMEEKIRELKRLREKSRLGGGIDKIKAQHDKGKLTARERIELLVDEGSFNEFDAFVLPRETGFGLRDKAVLGDGVVTGFAKIDERPVYVYSQDFTVLGGSLGEMHAKKIIKIIDLAMKTGCPLIGMIDSGGARIQEGILSLAGYAGILYRHTLASGVIPQIAVVLGPCAGGAAYSTALMDFAVGVEGMTKMFITGPQVIKAVTGVDVGFEELGGARIHAEISGSLHFSCESEEEAMETVHKLLSYLPSNNAEDPPIAETEDSPDRLIPELESIVPVDPMSSYDVRQVILNVVDNSEFLEIHEDWAKNIVVGFARLNGYPVGVVANQPSQMAGAIDINASIKAARFVRFCDAFNIPLIALVDVPGFMPGLDQEHGGIIRNGAKLLYAFSEATVPRITVILRKAYGGAYIVMNSKHIGADVCFAWPTAEIAVMGPEGAVKIIYKRELEKAVNKEKALEEFVEKYREEFANPYLAAKLGFVDDVIEPKETRKKLCEALEILLNKRTQLPFKKHGNIPL